MREAVALAACWDAADSLPRHQAQCRRQRSALAKGFRWSLGRQRGAGQALAGTGLASRIRHRQHGATLAREMPVVSGNPRAVPPGHRRQAPGARVRS